MKTNCIYLTIFLIVINLVTSCNDDNSPITPTNNTQEFFKYTINGGTERVFDSYAKGYHVTNTNSDGDFQKFTFRAVAETQNGGSLKVDGDFIYQDLTTFLNTSSFVWGSPDGGTQTTAKFYFSEQSIDGGFTFFPHPINLPSNPVVCTVTVNPNNVGDYIEFSFSGEYIDALDSSGNTTGTITGEARILRNSDQ